AYSRATGNRAGAALSLSTRTRAGSACTGACGVPAGHARVLPAPVPAARHDRGQYQDRTVARLAGGFAAGPARCQRRAGEPVRMRYLIRPATPADDAGILALVDATPQHGRVLLNFERQPAFLHGSGV